MQVLSTAIIKMGFRKDISPRKQKMNRVPLQNSKLTQAQIASRLSVSRKMAIRIQKYINLIIWNTEHSLKKRISSLRDNIVLLNLNRNGATNFSWQLKAPLGKKGIAFITRIIGRYLFEVWLRSLSSKEETEADSSHKKAAPKAGQIT